MPTDDRDLKPSDIQVLSSRDSIAAFFSSLGYNTDDKSGARVKQSVSALGITPDAIAKTIKHVERLADQENGSLQVYLFELSSVTVAAIRALARAFRDRAGKYLLVLTSDYENIDFIFLERVLPSAKEGGIATKGVSIRPHILTVKRRDPGTLSLRVLRRFTYTESDADAQADKLLSAFGVAEWSEKLFNNRALFSDYYLLERLPQSAEWSEQIKPQLLKLRELFVNVREKFGNQKEAVVREKLLQPIFELLGFTAVTGKDSKSTDAEPDYRLYQRAVGTSGKPLAVCLAYTWNRYLDGKDETRDTETPDENPGAHVVTLLEAGETAWAIVTNGKVWRLYSSKAHSRATNYYEIDLEETLAMQDPQEAFRFFWLLFRVQAFSPEEGIHKGEKRTTTFLDKLIEDSEAYAKELGEKLKSRVFDDIFPHFAEGFIEHMGGAEHFLSLSEEERDQSLREVFQGTLTFLYRLLFLLYSESRNLLPVNEVRGYWDLSLSRLKKKIADHAGMIIDEAPEKIKKAYRQDSSGLYTQLSKLFGVIDQGDADVNVPLYNGGLFITNPAKDDESPETRNARFLRTNKIPDRYLALGLDMMARDEDDKRHDLVSIDYKSLGVRHLGSIYEGLLEFKLRIATEKMAVVKGKKTEEVVAYKEAKKNELPIMTIGRGKNAEERVLKKGSVYLENDKRERKATGSYYTPDYIVKYIVENTVGPVLAEKLDALRPKLREAQLTLKKERDKYTALGGRGDSPENQTYLKHRQLVEDLFDIKVLDPAMGSGHFLVEAVDFISDKILGDKEGFLRAFPWNPITAELQNTRQTILNEMEKQGVSIDKNRLTDVNLLKRHILKRCIYGVDLNPMAVELAKVSLWLDCFTLGAPLSFLDHHLKCGNSLIGAKVEEVRAAVETGQLSLLGGTHFQGLLLATDLMRHIGELSDVTAEQVKNSRTEFKKAVDALSPFKRYMDVYASQWFGNDMRITGKGKGRTEISPALEFLRSRESEEWAKAPNKSKLPTDWKSVAATAMSAAEEKKFFHWELEYPEVFFRPRAGTTQKFERAEGVGFDAVIGNPPYITVGSNQQDIQDYYQKFYVSAVYKTNTYLLLYEKALKELLGSKRIIGFIIPNSILSNAFLSPVRKYLYENCALVEINDNAFKVFPEAEMGGTIELLVERVDIGGLPKNKLKIYVTHAPQDFINLRLLRKDVEQNSYTFPPSYQFFTREIDKTSIVALFKSTPVRLKDICDLKNGFNPGNVRDFLILPKRKNNNCKPMISGRHISRYEIDWDGWYVNYDLKLADKLTIGDIKGKEGMPSQQKVDFALRTPDIFEREKIVIRKTGDGIICSLDRENYYHDTLVHNAAKKEERISLLFILSILNSKIMNEIYRTVSQKEGSVFTKIDLADLELLPVPQIECKMGSTERTTLAEKVRNLYAQFTLDESLQGLKELINDYQRPNTLNGEVGHDLVAYLAEQMLNLNRQKQTEIRRLLFWTESELKIQPDNKGNIGINALSGKTTIRGFLGDYQKGEDHAPFDALWDVLLKNKNRMEKPLDSAFQSRMREEYAKSLAILLPVKDKLAATDRLIDQIVYRLYGLTEDETAIVEGKK